MTTTQETINDRPSKHGDFIDTARCAQALKNVITSERAKRHRRGQGALTPIQIEVLDLIATKIARIIAGDNNYADHWHDIGGYALLAENASYDLTEPVVNLKDAV